MSSESFQISFSYYTLSHKWREPIGKVFLKLTSSSNGIRFGMAASNFKTRSNPRYFGMRRGITLYNRVNNRGDQYWIDVVNCLMREVTYVLNGLFYQYAPEIKEHYTAYTGSYKDVVFGLFTLLGFRFAPRLRDLSDFLKSPR